MSMFSLALLALGGCLPAFTTPANAADGPAMVYRPSCFQGGEREVSLGYGPRGNYGGAVAGSRPASPSPSAVMAESASDDSWADSSSSPKRGAMKAEEKSAAPRPPPQDRPYVAVDEPMPLVPTARADWGGSTFLSNDDSMSLASAQRVLWAAANGRGVSAGEIRPHELLNYFSFDTAQPSGADVFEVTASAVQDGDQLSVALAVQGATPTRQPLDLTLVVDRSCSMQDEGRMEYVKRGLDRMSGELNKGDRVDVVLFDDSVCTPLENFVVGRDDPAILSRVVAQMQPEGGTDMNRGLNAAYEVASSKRDAQRRNRRVMAITDAQLNMGNIDPGVVSQIGKRLEDDGIRLTGVGVGRDFNDAVLNKLTEKGKGAYVYLGSEAVVDRVFGTGFDALVQTIAHDVHFELDLPDSLALQRFYGEESSTNKDDVQAIHYYAGTSQLFLQDLAMRSPKAVRADRVDLKVTWRDPRTGEPEKRVFHTTIGQMLDASPHNVHKAQALMAFTDVLSAQAMGGDACGQAAGVWRQRFATAGSDAELSYVDGLVGKVCPSWDRSWTEAPVRHSLVDLKVKVDSDIPIAEVAAKCESGSSSNALSAANTVARFRVTPGTCRLTLQGAVPMTTEVQVDSTGSDLRCMVRAGRLSCS